MNCALCGAKAGKQNRCYGCQVYICELCDKECGISGPHLFEDHFKMIREGEEQEDPIAQQRALDDAWAKAVEKAKAYSKSGCRFVRHAPIRPTKGK